MRKLAAVSLAYLLCLPLAMIGAPVPAVSQTAITNFSGASGATSVIASPWFDISHAQNAAIQIWCSVACAGTTVNVEIRSITGTSAAFPALPPPYIAAQCVNPPLGGVTQVPNSTCFFTLPLGQQARVDLTIYGGAGNVYAVYNERTF